MPLVRRKKKNRMYRIFAKFKCSGIGNSDLEIFNKFNKTPKQVNLLNGKLKAELLR